MKLTDILTPECIEVPLQATTKQAAIYELVDALTAAGHVKDPAALKDAVWTREQTRTTGIGHGLAIPHGKCGCVDSLAIAIGKPAQPLDFQAIDNKPVKLIILLASPLNATSDHIQALAHISRLMTVEEFRQKIYQASSAQEIFDLIKAQEQSAS